MTDRELLLSAIPALMEADVDKSLVSLKKTAKKSISSYVQGRISFSDSETAEMRVSLCREGMFGSFKQTVTDHEEVTQTVKKAIDDMMASNCSEGFIAQSIAATEITHGCIEAELSAMIAYNRALYEFIETAHPKIKVRVCNFSHCREKSLYCDLNGSIAEDNNGYYQIDISVSAVDGDHSTCLFGTSVNMNNLDILPDKLVALDAMLCDAERMLLAPTNKAPEENTIVFAPSCEAMIFYQLFNSQLSDFALSGSASKWACSFGKQVAIPELSVRIAPREECMCGMPFIDESGKPVKNTKMIDKGVLCGTMLSERMAQKLSLPAGNDAFCFSVDPGDKSLAELISDIRSGLLVTRLAGGTPTLSGEISMVAKGSYLIENGKISAPCEGICISGNLAEAMMKIDGISSERSFNGNCALPYLRVSGLKITGA